jgi:hypothetical protein
MPTKPNAARIALWSLAVAASVLLAIILFLRQPPLPALPEGAACQLPPPNLQIGPALSLDQSIEAFDGYGQEVATLRGQMQPNDSVHEFKTATTGGHAVMRGRCYVGQVVSWVR